MLHCKLRNLVFYRRISNKTSEERVHLGTCQVFMRQLPNTKEATEVILQISLGGEWKVRENGLLSVDGTFNPQLICDDDPETDWRCTEHQMIEVYGLLVALRNYVVMQHLVLLETKVDTSHALNVVRALFFETVRVSWHPLSYLIRVTGWDRTKLLDAGGHPYEVALHWWDTHEPHHLEYLVMRMICACFHEKTLPAPHFQAWILLWPKYCSLSDFLTAHEDFCLDCHVVNEDMTLPKNLFFSYKHLVLDRQYIWSYSHFSNSACRLFPGILTPIVQYTEPTVHP